MNCDFSTRYWRYVREALKDLAKKYLNGGDSRRAAKEKKVPLRHWRRRLLSGIVVYRYSALL